MILSTTLVLFATYQAGCAAWFCRTISRSYRSRSCGIDDAAAVGGGSPHVTVIMSLRGADADLTDTIACLLAQDYPAVGVRIVVDHEDDPAWPIAREAARTAAGRVDAELLVDRLPTCGSKNSALVQAASRLPPETEFVVIADADLRPHGTWLRELVAACRREGVGAAFGNRWFVPYPMSWGGLATAVWNAAAVVPMAMLGIPWGGSLAIRRSVLEASGVLELWSRSMVEDAPLTGRLAADGWSVAFVPSLLMPVRLQCDLASSRDFVKRQLLWTRLYHPHWWIIVAHAAVTAAIWPVGVVVAATAATHGDAALSLRVVVEVAAYLLTLVVLFLWMERTVVRAAGGRAGFGGWYSPTASLALPAAVLLAQALHTAAVLAATVARSVTWRGITYQISDPFVIHRPQEPPPPADC